KLRYKLPKRFHSKLIKTRVEHPIVDIDQTSDNFRFAAAVAGFSLLLKDSPYKGNINTELILDLANNALGPDPYGYRDGFVELVERHEVLESLTVK
ncbi:MAG: YfbK domain-containing protein, partial [Bacteroidota bacterium]